MKIFLFAGDSMKSKKPHSGLLALLVCIGFLGGCATSGGSVRVITPIQGVKPTVPQVQAEKICRARARIAGKEAEDLEEAQQSIRSVGRTQHPASGIFNGLSLSYVSTKASSQMFELCLAEFGYEKRTVK